MKTKKPSLQQILLAAGLALGGYAHAAGMPVPDGAPPFAQGGPGYAGSEGHGERGPGGPGMGPRGPEGMPPIFGAPPFLHGLDLSEAQQDKVFAILHAQAPYLREQDKAAMKARKALHDMAHATQYDDAKAASLAQAGAQALANIELQQVRTEQKLLAVLTPEQRKQLAERLEAGPARPPRP
jgi:Spy/CpxP family protein refolding chaperone